ncbi:unnamed protein product [Leuciscus chuanchicus]
MKGTSSVTLPEPKQQTSVLETKTSLTDHSSHDASIKYAFVTQEPKQQTSVIETKTSLTDHSSHDASNKDAVVTQEPKQQTSVIETKTSLTDHSSHDASNKDAVVTQEPKQQISVIETKTSLTDHSSHDASNKDAVVTQEPKQQTSVLETKTSLTDHSSHDASNKDAVVTQLIVWYSKLHHRYSRRSKDDFIPEAQETEVEDSVTSTQEPTSTLHSQYQRKSAKKRETAAKRSWTTDECAAVERHLRKFIVRSQVPGKKDCQRCVDAEAQALGNRDWKAVKYFIKNRISAIRRKVRGNTGISTYWMPSH